MRSHRPRPAPAARSAFAGFRFPRAVIVLTVRWYLRFGLSYRDLEELLIDRGVEIDHVTIYRWGPAVHALLADAARPRRHRVGDRWQVHETLGEGRRPVALRLPRHRPVRAGHRRLRRLVARHQGGPSLSSNGRSVLQRSRRLRSSPIRRRCTRPCWKTCCRRPGTARTGTPTIGSSATNRRLKAPLRPMRGLKQDRSARVSSPDAPSCGTSAAAITSWRLRSQWAGRWRSRSMSWPWRSDPGPRSRLNLPESAQRNRALEATRRPRPADLGRWRLDSSWASYGEWR